MIRTLLLILLSIPCVAQFEEVQYKQIALPEELEEIIDVSIINEAELYYTNVQESTTNKTGPILKVAKFDTLFNPLWETHFPLKKLWRPFYPVVYNHSLFYLFQDNESKNHNLIALNYKDGSTTQYHFKTLTDLSETRYTLMGKKCIVWGTYSNKPVIELHDLEQNSGKVLPEIFFKNHFIKSVEVNPYLDEIYVVIENQSKCETYIYVFDEFGNRIKRDQFKDAKHKLQQIEIRFLSTGEPIIVGTYASKCNNLSEGIFVSQMDFPHAFKFIPFSAFESAGLREKFKNRALISIQQYNDFESWINIEFYSTLQTYAGYSLPMNVSRRQVFNQNPMYQITRLIQTVISSEGRIISDQSIKVDGKKMGTLYPTSLTLGTPNKHVTLIPQLQNIAYLDSKQNEKKTFKLKEKDYYRLDSPDFALEAWGNYQFILHGAVYLNGTQQHYIFKRFQLKETSEPTNSQDSIPH